MTGNRISRAATIGAIVLACAAFALPASAQTSRIKGKVVDEKNQPVQDAKVNLTEQGGQNRKYELKTDKKGEYQMIGVVPGTYNIVASKDKLVDGFNNVRLGAGDDKEINFSLKAGGAGGPATKEDAEKRVAGLKAKFAQAAQLGNEGKYDEAIKLYNEVIVDVPQCAECYWNMGAVYEKKKDLAGAEAAYKKSIELNPNAPNAYQSLAGLYNQQQKYKEAGEMAAEADKRSAGAAGAVGGGSAESLYNRAVIAFNASDFKKADEYLSAAVKADPNHAESHFLRGNVLVQLGVTSGDLGKFGEAVTEFETYLKIAPNGPNAEKAKKSYEELKSFKK
jgi:tetratricopeptide (TPR) repeat protein